MLDCARAGAAVGAPPATLEKTRILGAYVRTLDEDALRRAAVYMSGRALSPSQRRAVGLGWSTLSKVISSVSGRDEEELGTLFRKHSDLGDWAGEALDARTAPQPVSMQDVEETLEAIRTARGNAKAKPLEALLQRLDPEEARFFVKIIAGEMRIGLSEGLVEAAPAIGHDVLFDGEVLAHRDGRVLRFFERRRRLGRKRVDGELRRDVPVVLAICDLLWLEGRPRLGEPLTTRRKVLEGLGL